MKNLGEENLFSEEEYNGKLFFRDDEQKKNNKEQTQNVWKVLIVDDEKDVHTMTKLSLSEFKYNNRNVEIVSAYSAKEAKQILTTNQNIAIVFIDIVMESDNAGLDLIKFIRNELKNNTINLIVRTGQPGIAPEDVVISDFDINNYQEKTMQTESKLWAITKAGLRTYETNLKSELYKRQLQALVDKKTLELNQKNKQLTELNNYKDKIFAIVGHDLLGPMGSLQNLLTLITTKSKDTKLNEIFSYLKAAEDTSKSIITVLEKILVWVNSQKEHFQITKEELNIKTIILEVFNLLSNQAIEKSIELIDNVKFNIPITSDREIITLTIRNLVANAIKFTPNNGKIIINALLRDDSVKFSVQDTGIGISEENIKKLFNIKEHISTYGTMNEKGTGIGLLICKELLTKIGGNIWVESKINKGSKFYFDIPL